MIITKHTKDVLEILLETISQYSECSCPFCFESEFPVDDKKQGYDKVAPEDATEWHLEHSEDCPVSLLEKAHEKIKER